MLCNKWTFSILLDGIVNDSDTVWRSLTGSELPLRRFSFGCDQNICYGCIESDVPLLAGQCSALWKSAKWDPFNGSDADFEQMFKYYPISYNGVANSNFQSSPSSNDMDTSLDADVEYDVLDFSSLANEDSNSSIDMVNSRNFDETSSVSLSSSTMIYEDDIDVQSRLNSKPSSSMNHYTKKSTIFSEAQKKVWVDLGMLSYLSLSETNDSLRNAEMNAQRRVPLCYPMSTVPVEMRSYVLQLCCIRMDFDQLVSKYASQFSSNHPSSVWNSITPMDEIIYHLLLESDNKEVISKELAELLKVDLLSIANLQIRSNKDETGLSSTDGDIFESSEEFDRKRENFIFSDILMRRHGIFQPFAKYWRVFVGLPYLHGYREMADTNHSFGRRTKNVTGDDVGVSSNIWLASNRSSSARGTFLIDGKTSDKKMSNADFIIGSWLNTQDVWFRKSVKERSQLLGSISQVVAEFCECLCSHSIKIDTMRVVSNLWETATSPLTRFSGPFSTFKILVKRKFRSSNLIQRTAHLICSSTFILSHLNEIVSCAEFAPENSFWMLQCFASMVNFQEQLSSDSSTIELLNFIYTPTNICMSIMQLLKYSTIMPIILKYNFSNLRGRTDTASFFGSSTFDDDEENLSIFDATMELSLVAQKNSKLCLADDRLQFQSSNHGNMSSTYKSKDNYLIENFTRWIFSQMRACTSLYFLCCSRRMPTVLYDYCLDYTFLEKEIVSRRGDDYSDFADRMFELICSEANVLMCHLECHFTFQNQ